jgi:hypothetical protein
MGGVMASSGVSIPDLDPPWPDDLTITVVTSSGSDVIVVI